MWVISFLSSSCRLFLHRPPSRGWRGVKVQACVTLPSVNTVIPPKRAEFRAEDQRSSPREGGSWRLIGSSRMQQNAEEWVCKCVAANVVYPLGAGKHDARLIVDGGSLVGRVSHADSALEWVVGHSQTLHPTAFRWWGAQSAMQLSSRWPSIVLKHARNAYLMRQHANPCSVVLK